MPLPIALETLFGGAAVEWERLEFNAGWDPLKKLQRVMKPARPGQKSFHGQSHGQSQGQSQG
jgi:hypothetical protein